MNVVHIKKSPLMVQKILRVFVNTLTVDDKHYLLNRDQLTKHFHVHLSQKENGFSIFFFRIFKSILNFKLLPKKDDPHT